MVKLIDFYADWCAPCKVMAPILEELAKDFAGRVVVEEVNVDENQALTSSHGVLSIPTYVVKKDDKEIGRLIGVNPKQKLVDLINQALA